MLGHWPVFAFEELGKTRGRACLEMWQPMDGGFSAGGFSCTLLGGVGGPGL